MEEFIRVCKELASNAIPFTTWHPSEGSACIGVQDSVSNAQMQVLTELGANFDKFSGTFRIIFPDIGE